MGLNLWLLQRFTALCMAFFGSVSYSYFSLQPFTDEYFLAFFQCPMYSTLYVFTVIMISLHAMIGIWAIAGDYLKCRIVRYIVLSGYSSLLLLSCIVAVLCAVRFV